MDTPGDTGGEVVTVTLAPALDVDLAVDGLVPEHKLTAVEHHRDPGGGGVNVARGLVRLGVACRAVVAVGGSTGDELTALLRGEGVAVDAVHVPGVTRESVSLRDRLDGTQYRVVVEPPPVGDEERLVDEVLELVGTPRAVVVAGMQPPDARPDLSRRLLERWPASLRVFDGPPPALDEVVRGEVDLVKPSRRELGRLVGRRLTGRADIVDAATEVLARGRVGALVVSLGADGAALFPRDGRPVWFDAPPVDRVLSTVGCGDAMVAGIVAALVAGRDLVDAVRAGVATGTATALTPGTALFDQDTATRLAHLVPVAPAAPS